jgi:hypothetical protein
MHPDPSSPNESASQTFERLYGSYVVTGKLGYGQIEQVNIVKSRRYGKPAFNFGGARGSTALTISMKACGIVKRGQNYVVARCDSGRGADRILITDDPRWANESTDVFGWSPMPVKDGEFYMEWQPSKGRLERYRLERITGGN